MIRWSYLKPKLIKLGLLWLFFALAFDPLLRWGLESAGSRALGAKVEIGKLKTKFFPPSISLWEFAAANPAEPMTNLFEFQSAQFKLAGRPLLERKVVIDDSSLEGIAWGTTRKTSGAPARSKPSPIAQKLKSWVESKSTNLFASASESAKADVTKEYKIDPKDLSSVKLADDAQARWPAAFKQAQEQIDSFNPDARVAELQKLFDEASKSGDVLQKVKAAKELQSKVADARKQLQDLKGTIDTQVNRARGDIQSIEKAKSNDLDAIMQRLHLPTFDTERVSAYLIGPAAAKKLAAVLHVVKLVRERMPKKQERPPSKPPERARGMTVEFPKEHSWPEFWLVHSALTGSAALGGPVPRESNRAALPGKENGLVGPVTFSGEAKDFSSNPPLVGRPAALNLAGGGKGRRMSLKAVLDHVTESARDRIDFSFAGLPIAQTRAGDPKSLAVTLSPGTASISGTISLDDDAMRGTVHFTENGINIQPDANDVPGNIRRIVIDAFKGIHTLDAQATLGGTMDEPDFKISTNLGKALAEGLQKSLGGELAVRRQALEKQLNGLVESKVGAMTHSLDDQNKAWLAKIGVGDQKLKELQDKIAAQIKLPMNHLPDVRKIFKFP